MNNKGYNDFPYGIKFNNKKKMQEYSENGMLRSAIMLLQAYIQDAVEMYGEVDTVGNMLFFLTEDDIREFGFSNADIEEAKENRDACLDGEDVEED